MFTCLEHNIKFTIRAGGHNVAGTSMLDNGVVIDVSRLYRVEIDRVNRIAVIQPGALWRDVDTSAEKFDLCTPGGIISDTGVAGLTLGGGIGWLNGLYGLACDNLVQAKVLLANGQHIQVNKDENSDLFWALKGGGGNFGLVTKFEQSLHELPEIYAGSILFPESSWKSALKRYVDTCMEASDNLTASFVATTKEGEKVISVDVCYAGNPNLGIKESSKFIGQNVEVVLSDSRKIRSYVNWQRMFDDDSRRGLRSYWRSLFIPDPSDEKFAKIFTKYFKSCPSIYTMLTFDHIHGEASRVKVLDTAYSHRGKMFLFLINTNWSAKDDDAINIDWCNNFYGELSSVFGGENYVNYLSKEESRRVELAYGDETFEKLKVIKRKYDPNNVFFGNQNISI